MKITENKIEPVSKEISYPAYFELKSPGPYKGMTVLAINSKWAMVVRSTKNATKPIGYTSGKWWAFTDKKVWKNVPGSFTIEL